MSDNDEQSAPYASSLEHLIDELGRVGLLAMRREHQEMGRIIDEETSARY